MFDHVTMRVLDRAAAEAFYDAVLIPLGVDATYSTRAFSVWHEFAVSASDAAHPPTRGLHTVFAAPSRAHVVAFWDAAAMGDRPGVAPPHERARGTYAAVVHDPEGNIAEAVHDPRSPNRRGSIVEHVRIAVADLPAAIAFYTTAAAATDLEPKPPQIDQARFIGAGGGSLTLVLGPIPTEHAHIAFPGSPEAVRRFHADAVAAGYRSNGRPGERPQYHDGYYAAYVLDPDGNNIEVVDHGMN